MQGVLPLERFSDTGRNAHVVEDGRRSCITLLGEDPVMDTWRTVCRYSHMCIFICGAYLRGLSLPVLRVAMDDTTVHLSMRNGLEFRAMIVSSR
jgi:hypothetical protein